TGRWGNITINNLVTKGAARGGSQSYPYAGGDPDGFKVVPDNTGGIPGIGASFPTGNVIIFPRSQALDNGFINIECLAPDPDYRLGFTGFQLVAFPPTLTAILPVGDSAAGGATATITGTDFRPGVVAITFGGTPATNIVQVNDTTYKCTVPAHAAGAVDVAMTDINGRIGTLTNGFTYSATPPPAITSITPN